MSHSISGQQMLTFPPSTLAAVHRAAQQDRTPAEAASLVRQVGFETGEGFLDAFSDWLEHHRQDPGITPAALSTEDFWHHLSAFFASLGWGRLNFEQLHPGVAALSSLQWAEADPSASARQPMCHFTTGMLADLLSRVIGSDLAVLEVSCRSRGDGSCRFLVGSSDALQVVFEGLRQGQPLETAVGGLA